MNIMIADDEKYACDRLADIVTDIPGCYVKARSSDGLDVVKKVHALDIDVVLMDIHMPLMNGLEAARCMSGKPNSPHVIFTTAYQQHALSAFEVNAQGFLLKPINRRQLEEKLNRLRQPKLARYVKEVGQYQSDRRDYIYCRIANQLELVALEEIIYFKSEQKYTLVRHVNGSHLINETLTQLEHEFNDIMMRVHRCAIVNKTYMKSLSRDSRLRLQLSLKCTPDKLLLSRRYITRVRDHLKQFSIALPNV